jgi:hypothetical protein
MFLSVFLAIVANVPSAEAVPDKDRENAEHLFSAKRNFIAEPLDIPGIAFCAVLADRHPT